MATNRVKNLSNTPTPNAEDLLLIIRDPSNLPANHNITIEQLFKNLKSNNFFLAEFAQVIVDRNLQVNGDIDLKNTATVSDVIKVVDSDTSTFEIFANGQYAHSDNRRYEVTIASGTQFTLTVDGGTASAPVTINSETNHELDSSNVYINFTSNTGHTTGDKFVVNINRESAINFGASSFIQEDSNITDKETSNNGTLLMETGVEIAQEVNPISLRANGTVLQVTGDTSFSNTLSLTGAATLSNTIAITGTSTQTGAVVLGTETVSGDGTGTDAVSVTTPVTFLNTSGGASTLTMAAGTAGQIKHIIMTVAGNDATMTNTNGNLDTTAVATQILFNAVGESATLIYTGTKWIPISVIGATIS